MEYEVLMHTNSGSSAITAEELIEKTKQANGILCQCAGCKAIRDEHGKWIELDNQLILLEDFEIRVTHGLCPDCAREATRDIERLDDEEPR